MYGHDAEPRGLWNLYQITNPAEIRGDRKFLKTREEIPDIEVIAQNLGCKTFPLALWLNPWQLSEAAYDLIEHEIWPVKQMWVTVGDCHTIQIGQPLVSSTDWKTSTVVFNKLNIIDLLTVLSHLLDSYSHVREELPHSFFIFSTEHSIWGPEEAYS